MPKYRITGIYQGFKDNLDILKFLVLNLPFCEDDEYLTTKGNLIYRVKLIP